MNKQLFKIILIFSLVVWTNSLLYSEKDHYVLKVISERKIYLNYGRKDNSNKDDIVIIQKSAEDLKDPKSGKTIRINNPYEYKVRILFVDEEYSIGEIILKDDYGIAEVEDRVKEKIDMKQNLYTLDGVGLIQKTYRSMNPNSILSENNLYFFISENFYSDRYHLNLFPSVFGLLKISMFRFGLGGISYNSETENHLGLFGYAGITPSFWITRNSTFDLTFSLNGGILSNLDEFRMNYSFLLPGFFNHIFEFRIHNWHYENWGYSDSIGGGANITLIYHYRDKKNRSYKAGYTFSGQKEAGYRSDGDIEYLHGLTLEYSFRLKERHLFSFRNESYYYSFNDSSYYNSYLPYYMYDDEGQSPGPMREYFINKVNVSYYYEIDNFHMFSISLCVYNYYDLNYSRSNIRDESNFFKNIAINIPVGFVISYF